MSQSLRDQLLKSGLASQKQARKARQSKGRSKKAARQNKSQQTTEQQQLAQEVAAARKAQRQADRQRSADAKAQREQRERKRQAIAIIKQNRIAIETPSEDEPPYSYTIKGRIKRLPVNRSQRQKLADGRLAIVRYDGETSLVDIPTAERLETLIPQAVVRNPPRRDDKPDPNDPYAGYEIPDDLMW